MPATWKIFAGRQRDAAGCAHTEEYSTGHIRGFINIPVDALRDRLTEIPHGKPVYVTLPERPAQLHRLPDPGRKTDMTALICPEAMAFTAP